MTTPVGKSPPNRLPPPVAEPHLADPAQTRKLREDILQQVSRYPSLYASAVGTVDSFLLKKGIGISQESYQNVMDNLRTTQDCSMLSEGVAHFREASSFSQDAIQSFKHGQVAQGLVEAGGAVINTGAGSALLPPGPVPTAATLLCKGIQYIKG